MSSGMPLLPPASSGPGRLPPSVSSPTVEAFGSSDGRVHALRSTFQPTRDPVPVGGLVPVFPMENPGTKPSSSRRRPRASSASRWTSDLWSGRKRLRRACARTASGWWCSRRAASGLTWQITGRSSGRMPWVREIGPVLLRGRPKFLSGSRYARTWRLWPHLMLATSEGHAQAQEFLIRGSTAARSAGPASCPGAGTAPTARWSVRPRCPGRASGRSGCMPRRLPRSS